VEVGATALAEHGDGGFAVDRRQECEGVGLARHRDRAAAGLVGQEDAGAVVAAGAGRRRRAVEAAVGGLGQGIERQEIRARVGFRALVDVDQIGAVERQRLGLALIVAGGVAGARADRPLGGVEHAPARIEAGWQPERGARAHAVDLARLRIEGDLVADERQQDAELGLAAPDGGRRVRGPDEEAQQKERCRNGTFHG